MNKNLKPFINGLITENPTFVLMLGMCPTLAVTTSAINGLGMGLTTTLVLVMSNIFISLLRKIIPDSVRIPAFIVVIASFVTIVEMLLQAYIPTLYKALGIYIPLIVVNCIILGRAEAFASKNNVVASTFDGLGMGLGFTVALTLIGVVRELLGSGMAFGKAVLPASYQPFTIFILAPGAFFVLAMFVAILNKIRLGKGKPTGKGGNCDALCEGCANTACQARTKQINGEVPQSGTAAAKKTVPSSDTGAVKNTVPLSGTATVNNTAISAETAAAENEVPTAMPEKNEAPSLTSDSVKEEAVKAGMNKEV
ncbi:MAG: electron transport complex subunit E [Lachnospiraceae bacterium]|nr:electron transport complex subunit E [Lachnospiraceae bacterium]